MCASGIFLYCTRAAVFAAAVCALWALWYALRGRKKAPLGRRAFWLRLLWLFYLAALVQITVLRSGREACSFWLRAQRGIRMNLRPFFTIRLEWRAGLWPFCYNVFGNIGWFMPFGLLGPAVRPRLRGSGARCSAVHCSAPRLNWGSLHSLPAAWMSTISC